MNTYSERGKLINQVRDVVENMRGQNLFDLSSSGNHKGKIRRTDWILSDLHIQGILSYELVLDIKEKISVDISKAGQGSMVTMEDLYIYALREKFSIVGEFHRKVTGR